MINGKVVRLILYPAKGKKGISVESAVLNKDLGMEGDYHATGGDKQITLLSVESRNWMEKVATRGLCFQRFRENITTEGIDLESLKAGHRLLAGTAILEITEVSKHCHEECVLFKKGEPCRLSGQSLFAKVVQSGVIRTGDGIVKHPRNGVQRNGWVL